MKVTDQTLVSWRHILGSLTLAVLLEQMPWSGLALVLRPDFVLVGVLFWALYQPARIGFGAAFFFGLLADFQDGVVFGQHAIAYLIGVYLVFYLRLRLLQFDPFRQAAQMFPTLLAVQLTMLLIGWLAVNPPGLAMPTQ
jgi:rod shape-determining protein MreD